MSYSSLNLPGIICRSNGTDATSVATLKAKEDDHGIDPDTYVAPGCWQGSSHLRSESGGQPQLRTKTAQGRHYPTTPPSSLSAPVEGRHCILVVVYSAWPSVSPTELRCRSISYSLRRARSLYLLVSDVLPFWRAQKMAAVPTMSQSSRLGVLHH